MSSVVRATPGPRAGDRGAAPLDRRGISLAKHAARRAADAVLVVTLLHSPVRRPLSALQGGQRRDRNPIFIYNIPALGVDMSSRPLAALRLRI